MKQVIVKNQTASNINLISIGETVPASGQVNISEYPSVALRADLALTSGITNGDLVINDGSRDYDVEDGSEYIRHDVSSDSDGFWLSKRRRFTILWNQTSHGFVTGEVLKVDDSTGVAVRAQADSHANSASSVIVQEVIDANSFYAGLPGSKVQNIAANAIEGGLPMTVGKAYFLSTTVAGQITATVPIGAGEIIKVIGISSDVDALTYYNSAGYENETALQSGPATRSQDGGTISRSPSSWTQSIDQFQINDPSTLSPSNGDRFVVGPSPVGVWIGRSNDIAEYVASSSSWHYTIVSAGFVCFNKAGFEFIGFNGSAWVPFDLNKFNTISGDVGTDIMANNNADTLNIVGDGNKISTSTSGDTITVGWGGISLDELLDVDTTGVSDNSGLHYNNTNSMWEILPFIQGINDLSDVNTTGIMNDSILVFNFSTSMWEIIALPSGSTDEQVGVSATDTTPGFLDAELVVGTGLAKAILTPAGNETLELSLNANLDDLNDTTITAPATFDTLRYTGSLWVNEPGIPAAPPGGANNVQLKFGPIATVTGTTQIPKDTSIPLITEGTQIWTETIDVQNAASAINIATSVTLSASTSSLECIFAVFRDNICVGVAVNSTSNKSSGFAVSFEMYDLPATTGNVTYSVRVGKASGASGTWVINNIHSNQGTIFFGGLPEQNSYKVAEIGTVI